MPIGVSNPGGGSGGGGVTTFLGLTDTPSSAGAENTVLVFDGSGNVIAQKFRHVVSVSAASSGTITGAAHGLGTAELDWQFVEDDGTDVTELYSPNVSINKTSFTVTWSTASAFTGEIRLRR